MYITRKMLREKKACLSARREFRKMFGLRARSADVLRAIESLPDRKNAAAYTTWIILHYLKEVLPADMVRRVLNDNIDIPPYVSYMFLCKEFAEIIESMPEEAVSTT